MLWENASELIEYQAAMAAMDSHVANILAGAAPEKIWLLEHPPLYTGGTSAKAEDLLNATRFPVFETGRGGQYTYHGPGQRVAYVMVDLNKRGRDLRKYIHNLEGWVIATLDDFGVQAERRQGRVGLWVVNKGKEEKIAAIGVRVRRWVTFHGVAINVNPDLSHFSGIVPCGLAQYAVTSLERLGVKATLAELDEALKLSWGKHFSNV